MLTALLLLFNTVSSVSPYTQWPIQLAHNDDRDVKVPIILGVMSRCPDALLCESVFDTVLKRVEEKVNITLSFIGQIDSSDDEFGVVCMHGRDECAGNVQELCAAKYQPLRQWWNYVQCQNFNGRDKIGLPDIATSCAKTAGFDWEESKVGNCAGLDGTGTGEEGIELLKASVNQSSALNIERSCTIIINEKVACIHDGTWKECVDGHTAADFIRQIESEYDKLNAS